MCIVRYISDSMIVPDNQQEECSDEEEKGSDEGNLFYAIWTSFYQHFQYFSNLNPSLKCYLFSNYISD